MVQWRNLRPAVLKHTPAGYRSAVVGVFRPFTDPEDVILNI